MATATATKPTLTKEQKKFSPTTLTDTELMETKEYNVFVLDNRNRPIDADKVNSFVKRFKEGKFYLKEFPGVVDDNFIILDGQHRFVACQKLGLPFYFRFADKLTIDNVTEVQLNAGWKTKEYLHSHVKQNDQNYIILQRFVNKHQLNISTSANLLNGQIRGSLKKNGFYTGTFVVKFESEAHQIAEAATDFFEAGFKNARSATFVTALAKIIKHPEYSHKRMMGKMKDFGGLLKNQTTIDLFVRNLELLYNYKAAEASRVRFI